MTPYFDDGQITIYCGDNVKVLKELGRDIADLVIADPPYFQVLNNEWDNQWRGLPEYIDWLEERIILLKSALLDNGSVYVFGDDKVIAYQQVMIDKYLFLLNSIVWYKTNNLPQKGAANFRSYAPMTERLLFYTPQQCKTGLTMVKHDVENFKPLRDYFRDYQKAIGLSKSEIIKVIGQSADHCFRFNSTQWDLPTKETYEQLNKAFPVDDFLRRDYEELRRDYEELRRDYEELRRTFHASSETIDVISGPIVSGKFNTAHPTTKPTWLIKKLIENSSNEGDTILDPFNGSGTTTKMAQALNRQAIGIELSEEYCQIAVERLSHKTTYHLPERVRASKPFQLSMI